MNTQKVHNFEGLLNSEQVCNAPRARTPLCRLSAAVALALSATCQSVFALGLGELTATSRLGEPLRAELSLIEASSERVEAGCFTIAPRPADADDLPRLPRATFVIDRRRQPTRLRISTTEPVNHPILMVGLAVGCGVELTREYALLLSPPELPSVTTQRTVAAPPHERGVPKQSTAPRDVSAAASEWQVIEGETLASIAEALYPHSRRAQRRWIGSTAKANPDLFRGETQPATAAIAAGTLLTIPDLRHTPRASRAELPAAGDDEAPRPRRQLQRPPRKSMELATTDRLSIGGLSSADYDLRITPVLDLSRSRNVTEAKRDLLRQERRLLAALEDQIVMQLTLADKIRQMEETLASLQASVKNIDQRMDDSAPPARPLPAIPATAPTASPPTAAVKPPRPVQAERSAVPDWLLFLSLAAAVLALLLFLRRRSQRQETEAIYEPTFAEEAPPAPEVDFPLTTDTPLPPQRPLAHREGDTLIQPHQMEEEHNIDVAEHESALELADIMLSFGRVQGAAQTLADYIEANPKQAVRPWLKLLEVYRDAGMQTEFDTLAHRLNQTFNIEVMSWDQKPPRRFPDTLEAYPHITAKLVEIWGSVECLDYLTFLVQDNRNGTRAGFPLSVLHDIMLLSSILEQHKTAYEQSSVAAG